jgi:hypothetical protein
MVVALYAMTPSISYVLSLLWKNLLPALTRTINHQFFEVIAAQNVWVLHYIALFFFPPQNFVSMLLGLSITGD